MLGAAKPPRKKRIVADPSSRMDPPRWQEIRNGLRYSSPRPTFTPPLRPASATVIPPFFSFSAISCLRWLEGTPLPSAFGPFGVVLSDALLALLDEFSDLLAALAADLLVESGAVLVAHGLAALAASQLPAFAS